jgi:hypothetical protein
MHFPRMHSPLFIYFSDANSHRELVANCIRCRNNCRALVSFVLFVRYVNNNVPTPIFPPFLLPLVCSRVHRRLPKLVTASFRVFKAVITPETERKLAVLTHIETQTQYLQFLEVIYFRIKMSTVLLRFHGISIGRGRRKKHSENKD